MFPSIKRRGALVAIGLTAAIALGTTQTAFADEGSAPVLDIYAGPKDITAQVLDIYTTVTSLDGSVADQRSGGSTKVTLAADVLFAFDRSELSANAISSLRQTASLIRSRSATGTQARIDGYTDSLGSGSYNQALSGRRAASVKAELAKLLGTGYPLSSEGHGAAAPVAANTKADGTDNPGGRALNRRVTVSFGG